MNSSSAIARSTMLRRSIARFGLANGERLAGLWITPAITAASLMLRFVTSFPKNSRDASATPWIANDPRCPR